MIPKHDPILETELVLIHIDHKPAFYARVEAIHPDVKPKWWQVRFLFLTLPLQLVTWIIDGQQIRGAEFTMGGTPVRIEKVVPPEEPDDAATEKTDSEQPQEETPRKARVLAMNDRGKGRKKK
jgi:hypothetical protein